MPTFTQSSRIIAIETPLGPDALLLKSFQMNDALGRPFSCTCDLRSEKHDLDFSKIVGQPATIRVEQTDKKTRYINGVISHFSHVGTPAAKRINKYSATIVPALWFLTRTAYCRIFQQKSVTDVIKEVLQQFGVTNVDLKVTATYAKREYIVQYRETAFNFISRLMEEEGIFYFFNHENGKHTMVIADAPAIHKPAPGYDKVQFMQHEKDAAGHEHITSMTWEHTALSGVFLLRDFDFKAPAKYLDSDTKTVQQKHIQKDFEVYDYPGFFETKAEGDRYVKVRMEESDATHEIHRFSGDTRGLTVGCKFKLYDYPAEDMNKDYVVTAMHFHGETEEYGSAAGAGGGAGNDQAFYAAFTAIPATVPFRTLRTTPKPCISGPQTAFVSGPSGEEIHVDDFGRVKVHFNWDRDGKGDGNDSCWIRVSQGWAGKKWGMVFLPRVGQEVIVEFLEGDPDRPIVTGRVYNGGADGKIPYALPDFKTISSIKTCSSKGAGGFNELRFEDKKGEEQIFIHGEKNMDVRVKNDCFETILHDRHLVIANDQVEHIQNDRSELVDRDHKEQIKRDRNLKVEGKEALETTGSRSLKVTGAVIEEFGNEFSTVVTKDAYLKATNIIIEATENITLKVTDGSFVAIEKDSVTIKTKAIDATATEKGIDLKAMKDITVKSDTAGIAMKATKDIAAEATMNASIKGTAGVAIEGTAQVDIKSPMTTVKGDGMLTLKGGMVMIN